MCELVALTRCCKLVSFFTFNYSVLTQQWAWLKVWSRFHKVVQVHNNLCLVGYLRWEFLVVYLYKNMKIGWQIMGEHKVETLLRHSVYIEFLWIGWVQLFLASKHKEIILVSGFPWPGQPTLQAVLQSASRHLPSSFYAVLTTSVGGRLQTDWSWTSTKRSSCGWGSIRQLETCQPSLADRRRGVAVTACDTVRDVDHTWRSDIDEETCGWCWTQLFLLCSFDSCAQFDNRCRPTPCTLLSAPSPQVTSTTATLSCTGHRRGHSATAGDTLRCSVISQRRTAKRPHYTPILHDALRYFTVSRRITFTFTALSVDDPQCISWCLWTCRFRRLSDSHFVRQTARTWSYTTHALALCVLVPAVSVSCVIPQGANYKKNLTIILRCDNNLR